MPYFYISLIFVAIAFFMNNRKFFYSFVRCCEGLAFAITGLVDFGLMVGFVVLLLYTNEAEINPWLFALQMTLSVVSVIYILIPFKNYEENKPSLSDHTDDNMRIGNRVRRSKRTMVHGGIRDRGLRDGRGVYHWRADE